MTPARPSQMTPPLGVVRRVFGFTVSVAASGTAPSFFLRIRLRPHRFYRWRRVLLGERGHDASGGVLVEASSVPTLLAGPRMVRLGSRHRKTHRISPVVALAVRHDTPAHSLVRHDLLVMWLPRNRHRQGTFSPKVLAWGGGAQCWLGSSLASMMTASTALPSARF